MPYTLKKIKRINQKGNKNHYILFDENGYIEEVQLFLKHLLNIGRSENTIRNYALHIKIYLEFLEEYGLKFNEIHQQEKGIKPISYFVGWLRNPNSLYISSINKDENEDVRSAKTVNIIVSTVLNFYDFLSRAGRINNIAAYRNISKRKGSHYQSFFTEMFFKSDKKVKQNIFKLREAKYIPRAVTRDEYNKILEAAGNGKKPLRNQLMIALMFECGLRNSELRGLCVEDLVGWEQELEVKQRDISIKYGSERTIYVPEHVLELYADYMADEYNYERVENKKVQYLFINENGEPLSYQTIKKMCNGLSKKTNINFTPHELRHGHGTELFESKVQTEVIMKRLGHKHISSTEIYTHVRDDYMKKELKEAELRRMEKKGE